VHVREIYPKSVFFFFGFLSISFRMSSKVLPIWESCLELDLESTPGGPEAPPLYIPWRLPEDRDLPIKALEGRELGTPLLLKIREPRRSGRCPSDGIDTGSRLSAMLDR
jgi:hypothetical protein